MRYSTVIGIDVSKKKLDLCVLSQDGQAAFSVCSNTEEAVRSELSDLLESIEDRSSVLVCAEHTSIYTYPLVNASECLSVDLWLENPAQIKLCSGVQRGKNDKVDAERIAVYAKRYHDDARLFEATDKTMEELHHLLTEREMYVGWKAVLTGQLSDQKGYMEKRIYANKQSRAEGTSDRFKEVLAEIDQQIESLIKNSQGLKRQYEIARSVPGIGPQTALTLLAVTKGFTQFTEPKKLCCHAGVAPFAHQSGSALNTKWRVSQRANKRLKTLLHMAALTVVRLPGELGAYYRRKTEEGKNAMCVLNAIRAKLIHRVLACIRQD